MTTVLAIIGTFATVIGIVWLFVGVIRKKQLKIPASITIIGLALMIVGAIMMPTDTKAEPEKQDYNAQVITAVQKYVGEYDKIDNVDWKWNDRDYNIKEIDSKSQKNVYSSHGTYTWQDRKYNYDAIISFPDKDYMKLLQLHTDMGTNYEDPTYQVGK
ncbi:hypothetical protein HBP99_04075 [Listeria booriae]|uniref:hypothetical protein n=1 Tax=Listeria booriae TaxID=1552123 RepID=UPI001626DBAF|nr:hypothetical protein [Listeria booriae]MBC2367797.1 hypothetical protein [Listeria booriae]